MHVIGVPESGSSVSLGGMINGLRKGRSFLVLDGSGEDISGSVRIRDATRPDCGETYFRTSNYFNRRRRTLFEQPPESGISTRSVNDD